VIDFIMPLYTLQTDDELAIKSRRVGQGDDRCFHSKPSGWMVSGLVNLRKTISEACNIARAATAMRHITVYMSHRSDNTQTASCIVAQNQ